jgi:O-antigen ligase
LALALTAVPISIAASETLLTVALISRLILVATRRASSIVPRVFWIWLGWATLEIISWTVSPEPRAGWSEIRRLLLCAALFLVMPALDETRHQVAAWRGVFLAAALSSLFLIGDFASRLIYYRRELALGGDPSLYLRSGGLLNNWMVFGTVAILVLAALLAFSRFYPEEKRVYIPLFVITGVAIVVSLTRMLWVCSALLLAAELIWRRSRWTWVAIVLPLALYLAVPGVIRTRVKESMDPGYYANAERVQMLRVGWKMIRNHPLAGVGAGRVERLYANYLSKGEAEPAYHGHLHNNLVQMAAQSGIPVAVLGVLLVIVLFRDLTKAWKRAQDRGERFLCRTAILGLAGFTLAGAFDYTYGHSLAIILLSFAVLSPLIPRPASMGRSE